MSKITLTKRGTVWYLDTYIEGQRKKVSTGCRDESEAWTRVPDILKDLVEESAGANEGMTIGEGFQQLSVEERRSNRPRHKLWQMRIKEVKEFLGEDTPLAHITRDSLVKLQHHLMTLPGRGGRPAAPATVNRKMAEVHHLLNVAHRDWGAIDAVPKVRPLKVPKKRRRALSEKEITRLMEVTLPRFQFLWQFLIETGLRTSEWLALDWEDINLDARRLYLTPSERMKIKTDAARVVWLTPDTVEEFRRRLEEGFDRPLEDYTRQTTKTEWNRCKKEMGLEHDDQFVPYSLRHTCATRLVARGVPTSTVQKHMGHADIATTTIYLDQSEEDLKVCAEAVSIGDLRNPGSRSEGVPKLSLVGAGGTTR